MFEIFGAIFGGAYFTSRLLKEKNTKINAQSRIMQGNLVDIEITDSNKENELKQKLYYHNPPEVKSGASKLTPEQYLDISNAVIQERNRVIHEEIPKSDMDFIFGSDWELYFSSLPTEYEDLKDPHTHSDFFVSVWDMILNIWLSTYGYVSTNHTINGYEYRFQIPYLRDDWRDVAKKACQVIERNIKHHHPNINGLDLCNTIMSQYYAGCKVFWAYRSLPSSIIGKFW